MQWNKYFVATKGYSGMKDQIACFADFYLWLRHLEKHIWNTEEPWEKVFNRKKYEKNQRLCQISEQVAVQVYEDFAPEIAKGIHFMFLCDCFYWEEMSEKKAIYGIDPRGFILVASQGELLTSYFPEKACEKKYSDFHCFWESFEHLQKKIKRTKKSVGEFDSVGLICLKYENFPQFYSMNHFISFLENYKKINNNDLPQQLKNLIQEASQ